MGSVMHGLLMEQISTEWAETLHAQGLRPYTQQVYFDNRQQANTWRLTTLNTSAYQVMVERLAEYYQKRKILYLKHHDLEIDFANYQVQKSSYKELADASFLQAEVARRAKLYFNTPTGFKSDGEYLLYPQVGQIIKSLLTRWNTFASSLSLEDEQVLAHLIAYSNINSYRLEMTKFSLEKVRIPAFRGSLEIYTAGPEALVRVANLLVRYAEYSGLGIKTALGMGGIKTLLLK